MRTICLRPILPILCAIALTGSLSSPGATWACGAVVQPPEGTVGLDAQRAFLSVQGGRSEWVLQVFVPSAQNSFAVLVPVPSEPLLDDQPVDDAELTSLEGRTRPTILLDEPGGSGGCGCGALGAKAGGESPGGILAGRETRIGPVTAVPLSADTGTALTTWLQQNGYAIPAGAQRIVDGYAGPGRWFVAIKRNEAASPAPGGVGVHLSLLGDHRGYALRMAQIGAARTVAITVFVAAPEGVGPAAPFAALTLNDLDKVRLRAGGYRAAVEAAVSAASSRAFVIEGVFRAGDVLGGRLLGFAEAGARLTRLSTVMASAQMTEDVAFTAPAPKDAPGTIVVSAGAATPSGPPALPLDRLLGTLLLLLAGWRLLLHPARPRRDESPAPQGA